MDGAREEGRGRAADARITVEASADSVELALAFYRDVEFGWKMQTAWRRVTGCYY